MTFKTSSFPIKQKFVICFIFRIDKLHALHLLNVPFKNEVCLLKIAIIKINVGVPWCVLPVCDASGRFDKLLHTQHIKEASSRVT